MSEPSRVSLLPPPGSVERRQLAILLAVTLLSRLLLFPRTPFDVDAVLLTRGVVSFDPTAMRPHPPGYPGLIALAAALPVGPALALRLVSAFSSVPLVLGTYALARRLGSDALLAAALMAANPIAWLYGVTENAYGLGGAGAVWVAFFALNAREREGQAPAAMLGLALGLASAARPSLLAFLAPLALWAAGPRRWPAFLGGLAPPTLLWLLYCGQASGGMESYFASVEHQFAWIREGHPDFWRWHQVHHLSMYCVQALAGGVVLLPWLRRPARGGTLLLAWAAVPFGFDLFVYVAKPGYLLEILPALIVALAASRAPAPARVLSVALSALFFLGLRPVNLELDATPRLAFGQKTWPERIASELSFIAMSSHARLRQQDEANEAYVRLLSGAIEPGHTAVIWVDRWDPAIAAELMPEARVIDPRSPHLGVPATGLRVVLLAWEAPEGFTPITDDAGYGAFVREISVSDLPMKVGNVELLPAF